MPHILVVEDDRANAKLFELVLNRVGAFDVTVTEDASEVMEIASSGTVDLILMDVSLSNTQYQGRLVDGVDMCRLLKGDTKTSSIPIILTTAHAMRGDREHFLELSGADDYFSKPIEDKQALISMAHRLMETRRAA
ncbi:MAG: response regulator [Armatimonadetes bacterium]|nr:response regulator [Armatimonadota bacterium]